jgi:hypothetical protein
MIIGRRPVGEGVRGPQEQVGKYLACRPDACRSQLANMCRRAPTCMPLTKGRAMTEHAFVVMQVGSENSAERERADEVTAYVINPVLALDEIDLAMVRADQDATPGLISPKMLADLLSARIVIADLTGRNPNVYYELGIAHSFGKAVISLGQPSGLPFDLRDERVIPLPVPGEKLGVREAEAAKARLLEALRVVLDKDYVPVSPLSSVASSRALEDLAPSNPVAAEIAALREKVDDVRDGLLGDLRAIRAEVDRKELEKERQERYQREISEGAPQKMLLKSVEENPELAAAFFQTIASSIGPHVFDAMFKKLVAELPGGKLPTDTVLLGAVEAGTIIEDEAEASASGDSVTPRPRRARTKKSAG